MGNLSTSNYSPLYSATLCHALKLWTTGRSPFWRYHTNVEFYGLQKVNEWWFKSWM